MKAALVAIGSELLRMGRRDTNGDWLTARLNELGVEVASRVTLEDDPTAMKLCIRSSMATADIVILTGGLGPTEDDRTREALSCALGRPTERDPEVVARLRGWFERRGYTYNERQSVQADRPRGAAWIPNPIGTAPGILLESEGRTLAALPGVPAEMKRMFDDALAPAIRARGSDSLIGRSLKVGGLPESVVESRVRDLYGKHGSDVTILSSGDGIELHLRVSASDGLTARSRLDALEAEFRDRLGDDLYGVDGDTLAAVVGAGLAARGLTVATAESCTGGGLAAALTDTAGASGWFRGGLVVYSNDLKTDLANVDASLLETHGAVSQAVAEALARGVRERCGADLGVGITGIAGPDGGSADKPVGLVHLGLADENGVRHRELRMVGDRALVRRRTVSLALDWIRRRTLES